jgi:hypothetical protein
LFIPKVAGGILHDAWCSPVGLQNVSQAVWSWHLVAAAALLCVTWCGEAFYGLEVQGVENLILLGALFLPSVALAHQQGF